MAKPVAVAKVETELKEAASAVFIPDNIGKDDFFRLKRVGNCWQVEMVRLSGDKVAFRRDVYAEDVLPNAEARCRTYCIEAERRR
jgi:hypothetical protein